MDDLEREVSKGAERAVEMASSRGGAALDYSEASLDGVEEIVAEVGEYAQEMTEDQLRVLAEDIGCYILEVGRRAHGGKYLWYMDREPVLVVGEPAFHVAIVAWGKVRGRLSGDGADNLVFFFKGFADRVRGAKPGDRALYA